MKQPVSGLRETYVASPVRKLVHDDGNHLSLWTGVEERDDVDPSDHVVQLIDGTRNVVPDEVYQSDVLARLRFRAIQLAYPDGLE